MRQDKFTKFALVIYAFFLIPVVWAAIIVAPHISGGIPEIIRYLPAAMDSPFDISWTSDTPKCIAIFIAAYLIGLGIYLSTVRNYRHRE